MRIPAVAVVTWLGVLALLPAQARTASAGRIRDLHPVSNTRTSVTLAWTSVGGDSYRLRVSRRPIADDAGWEDGFPVFGLESPRPAGSQESFEVADLKPGTIYYFALRAGDDPALPLSNESSGNTRFEGYGFATLGGSGSDVCHVTSLDDTGHGSLRACVDAGARLCGKDGPRTVVFDLGGEITLRADIVLKADDCKLTLDGGTAPAPGITIRKPRCSGGLEKCPVGDPCIRAGEFKIGASSPTPTSDIIVSDLRFNGNYEPAWGACKENSAATLGLQYHFKNIVLDHLTLRNGPDSNPDVWSGKWDSSDVTISHTFIFRSNHPLTISGSKSGGSRRRVSIHHNLFADCGERMPNALLDSADLEIRNNVISGWNANHAGSYGTRVRNLGGQAQVPKVMANIVGNAWVPGPGGKPMAALVYGEQAGSSSDPRNGDGGPPECTRKDHCAHCPEQGTVLTASFMGEIWTAGNILPRENCDQWSTVPAERPVPADAAVTTQPASDLTRAVLSDVGVAYRTEDEQRVIDEIARALAGTPRPAAAVPPPAEPPEPSSPEPEGDDRGDEKPGE